MVIPSEVKTVLEKLRRQGYEAYVVGGCVRDLLLKRQPQDWDVATNAKPEEIQRVFPESFYENQFLTVTVKTGSKKPALREIEVTTYRSEAGYSDKRHPDQVRYAKSLEEDLSRRDFTVNAMALEMQNANIRHQNEKSKFKIIDLFGGQDDLKSKTIRTVGKAGERFAEDALRLLRAVRLATVLGFSIETETADAIREHSKGLESVSKERIRDELVKIIMSPAAAEGIERLRSLNLLPFVLPELLENYGIGQNKHHIYDCYQHALKALEYAAKKGFVLTVRLAAVLHDVGKPRVKRGEGAESTFYNHEVVGARMAERAMDRLKFSRKEIEAVENLIRHHMFYYNVGEVSESSVRRLVKNVGPDNMEALLQLREADRIGSGVPKAEPYKLRHLKYIIEKVSKDPISVKMLKAKGNDVMGVLGIQPGPKVGQILDILLGYVLDDPAKNKKVWLKKEIAALGALDDKRLQELAAKSKGEKVEAQTKEEEGMKQRYWVK